MSNTQLVASPVYETTDYGRFKFSGLNRPVERARVEFWKRALVTNDLLCDNPILVDDDGSIIDGQHRLAAAQELGLIVFYRIATKARVADAPMINSQNKAWTFVDYMTAWCNAGNPNYIKLRSVCTLYPWMQPGLVATLMYRRGTGSTFSIAFQTGSFVVNDDDYVHVVASRAHDFIAYAPFWRQRTFVSAIANLCDNPAYDHGRMMNKMKLVGNKLLHCSTIPEYIDLMSSIYNYRTKADSLVVLKALHNTSTQRISNQQPTS